MVCQIESISNVVVVVFSTDDLDAENSERFSKEIEPHLQSNAKVLLDLGKLNFVDSSGLGSFLACKRKLDALNGSLKLCCVTETVKEILQLVRLVKVFDIYDSREDALSSFS